MTSRSDDDPTNELSSPACMMRDADDAYMGFASREELIEVLNVLIEVERAGLRVALESARAAGTGPVADLMRALRRDEARWCAMLSRHIKALGASPSSKVGAFRDKLVLSDAAGGVEGAMAIDDIGERLAFLNRAQGWVVRKLRETLPRVRNDALHADLTEMLAAHEANIARVDDFSARGT